MRPWVFCGEALSVRVCSLECREPGGHHQATDRNGRQEGKAEMEPTKARSRKRWMNDENKEIWRCYRMSDPAMRGYRKRMHSIWHERNNAPQTEQRLVNQILVIMKNNWFSGIEREWIERQLTHNEIRDDQEEQIERPNSQDKDSHNNTPPAARFYVAGGNTEYLNNIKEWMQLESD